MIDQNVTSHKRLWTRQDNLIFFPYMSKIRAHLQVFMHHLQ